MTTNLSDLERAALAWRKADKRWHESKWYAPAFSAPKYVEAAEQRLRAAADRVLAADEVTG